MYLILRTNLSPAYFLLVAVFVLRAHVELDTVWKTLDLEKLILLQKLNYWEMGSQIYISCSYGT